MTTRYTAASMVVLLAVMANACALGQQEVEQELSNPARIDCRTAEGDLRVLQSEKSTLAERVAEGVTAISPAGIVLGAATGTEGTKLDVAAGDYDAKIDARIAEIERKCHIGDDD